MFKRIAAAIMVLGTISISSAVLADDWADIRFYAAGKDQAQVTAMLNRGVNVNIQNDEGWTPLMIAAEAGDPAMVKLLLSRGANPSILNNRGRSAYDVTLSSEVRALLKPAATPAKAVIPTTPPRTTGYTPAPQTPMSTPAPKAQVDKERSNFCQSQYRAAVAAFCSDNTCKMRENRKWSACLKNGRYN